MDSQGVAEFVAGLTWEQIPATAQHRAKLAFRDTLGTMLGGGSTTAGRVAATVAAREGSRGDALIVSTGERAGRPMAAYANGVAASALDFDDGHYAGGAGHPGSPIVSALLAAAAQRDTSGREFLAAQVAAYEVAIRAGSLLWPKSDTHQYHGTGTMGCIGGAVGCAKLLGADIAETRSALGIGWSHAPMAAFGMPMVKESIGWAACSAVMAGLLAVAGIKAGGAFGERPTGIPFDRDDARDDRFVNTLGREFESARTYFKPYAACRYTHAAADALKQIMGEHSLSPEQIASVEVHTIKRAQFLNDQEPETLENAQYSFPFVLGALAEYGAAGAEQINEERLTDARTLAFARRVSVRHDPAMDAEYPAHYGSLVRVATRNGARYEERRIQATGELDLPIGDAELRAKFISLAEPQLGERDAERLADICERFESTSLTDVLKVLSGTPARA